MVRLEDVAKRAGVSKNTASRVLNNRGYISAETKQKVRDAIKELNYHPNETARNLLKGRSGLIGLLVPSITYDYYSEIIDSVEKELAQRDYKLLLCNFSHNVEIERRYLKMFQSCRVDGLIICDHELKADDYADMAFPIVSIDRYVQKGVSFICSNHSLGGQLAAEELLRCGCRDVLQIAGPRGLETPWSKRHEVFEKLMAASGTQCHTVSIKSHDASALSEKKEILRNQLAQHPDYDGFFGGDPWAVAALQEALAIGKRVPEDFKIVGYDGTLLSEITTPAITTIRTHADKIAYSAVDTVCKMIDDPSLGSCEMEFNVELIQRQSTE